MELRRALLLFAIVLGLAAVATSVSRPPERRERQQTAPPSAQNASPGATRSARAEITFTPADRPSTKRLEAGRPATVVVEVERAGQVEIGGLGLNGFADPLTPARFEVLTDDEATHPVRFIPSNARESKTLGVLEIGPAPAGR